MIDILDILTILGEHFVIVAIACVEVFIGIILIGRMVGEKSQIRKAEKGISGVGEQLLKDWGIRRKRHFL